MDMRSSLISKASNMLMGHKRIILMVDDRQEARRLVERSMSDLAWLAWSMRMDLCEVRWANCPGYEVYASVIKPEPMDSKPVLGPKGLRWMEM
ncbi:MAG TPA: hypothetical protein V6C65_35265, partial [Allocoleopsis sp.]